MSTVPAPATRHRRRWPWLLPLVVLLPAIVAGGEAWGWPFLAEPIQRWLSSTLQRRVDMAIDGHMPASVSVRLLGRIRLEAPAIEIGAPPWSRAPYMLRARDAVMSLHYADLWRAHRGQPLRIASLDAAEVDAMIERLPDGRASWQFGTKAAPPAVAVLPFRMPLFDQLKVGSGTVRWRDERAGLHAALRLSTTEGSDGTGLTGRFEASGASLADIGLAIGVGLPATPAFAASGVLVKQPAAWHVDVERLRFGTSDLKAALDIAADAASPRITGRVSGARLTRGDLPPATATPPGSEADLQIDIDSSDLKGEPLRGRLQLSRGVLTLGRGPSDSRTKVLAM
ncbi:MAG TPA: hypothetical protein VGP22_18400 [Albitalea sp.]|nr:hypothetical protein [Albitalea sp.]